MTLYLKYRPQKLSDLDLDSVRESLRKIVKSDKIPHAFLFSGPKGTGKTSAARILAKILNCEKLNRKTHEPCNSCKQCKSITRGDNLDVIELDAASHRGIDDIRSLRDAVKLSPASAHKKVYIIDEAHMLTTEASNALLKTLEEPPEHVMFILATTNPEKLIPTIISRSTNIKFSKANKNEIVSSLTKVVKGEKLRYDKDALEAIALASDGSFRDADKIVEQLMGEGIRIEKKAVESFLYSKDKFQVEEFITNLIKRNLKNALDNIEYAVSEGITAKRIIEIVVSRLRDSLLAKEGIGNSKELDLSKNEAIQLIKLLLQSIKQLPSATIEQVPLEIAVIEWCETNSDDGSLVKDPEQRKIDGKKGNNSKNGIKTNNVLHKTNNITNGQEDSHDESDMSGETKDNGFSRDLWASILTIVRPRNTSTEALLRASKPIDFDGKTLTLGVFYRFHKEKLESHPHIRILEETIMEATGKQVRVNCILAKPPVKTKLTNNVVLVEDDMADRVESNQNDEIDNTVDTSLTDDSDDDIINAAKEIFGS